MVAAKELNTSSALRVMQHIMNLAASNQPAKAVAICVMGIDKVVICSVRMDGACGSTVAHAEAKARTALAFERDTREFAQSWTPEDLANARTTMPGFVSWGGGVLLYGADGYIVGAVAVSGLSEEADHRLAVGGSREWNQGHQ